MDYQSIYNRCQGDKNLTIALCREFQITIVTEPYYSPLFKAKLTNLPLFPSVQEIIQLKKSAMNFKDYDRMVDLCYGQILPFDFIVDVLENMAKLATDFFLKVEVLNRTDFLTHSELFPEIKKWVIENGTFDQWVIVYHKSGIDSIIENLALEQITRILKSEQPLSSKKILPDDEYYEEHLVSP